MTDCIRDYFESAENTSISRTRAVIELARHGITDTKEFFDDLGDRDIYTAQEVLIWLGYP
jgi:hypothetical protein